MMFEFANKSLHGKFKNIVHEEACNIKFLEKKKLNKYEKYFSINLIYFQYFFF